MFVGYVEKVTQKSPFYTFYSISYYYICNVLSYVICFNYINCNSPCMATECVLLSMHHGIGTERKCLCKHGRGNKSQSLAQWRPTV